MNIEEKIGIFRRKVKAYRKKRKMKQNELEELIGVSRSYVSALETGKKTPSLYLFLRFSEVMELTPNELLDIREVQETPSWSGQLMEIFADCSPREVELMLDLLRDYIKTLLRHHV